MPESICSDIEAFPFRLLRSLRVAALRLTNPDRYRAIIALRAAARVAATLSRAANRSLLSSEETLVYTQLQSSLQGKARLSSRSLLPLTADIFVHTKKVISVMHHYRPRNSAISDTVCGLLEGAASLLRCFEMQLGSSAGSEELYRKEFRRRELDLREALRRAKMDILCLSTDDRAPHGATILTSFEELLSVIGKAAYAASKRLRRRRH